MRIKRFPAGFVIPAQPVMASRPPSGADWVHEIKHDGYRLIVRRDGPTVRLYTRNAYDWTVRLPAIAAAAQRIKAKSFTIDGEAVVLGLTACHASMSCVDSRLCIARSSMPSIRSSTMVRIFATVRFSIARQRSRGCLRDTEAGILINEHVVGDGPTVFEHACRLGAEGIVSKKVDGTYRSGRCPVWIKVRNPASVAVQRERSEKWNR